MQEHLLIGLAAIIILGIGAQWLAWRVRIPSILLLLLAGILAGPVTGFLDPDELLGDVFFPTVSVSVAIILFEGGLNLKIAELRKIGAVIRNLVTIGALVTWAGGTMAAVILLDLDFPLALLLGAVLVVSGPTVIIPLLRSVRPSGNTSRILRWEGIVIDPIGALLAVLVFEAILSGGFAEITTLALGGILRTVLIGGSIGVAAALLLLFLLQRYWIPDFLQETVSLMFVIASFAASNVLQPESGLLAATVMGIVLVNQKRIPIIHIVEFKENLRVLLIAILFILLSSRLKVADVGAITMNSVVFLLVLIFIIRPLAVFVSTVGSALEFKEKLFLSVVSPRGIVAASVSSIFALRLSEAGYVQAESIVPITFLVIIGTVSLSGLISLPLARILGVAQQNPQGALIVGAHDVARNIATALQKEGFRVLLVDTDWANIRTARMEGLTAHYESALSEYWLEKVELEEGLNGIGRIFAMTSNDEANSLATLHLVGLFGKQETYQLCPNIGDESPGGAFSPTHLRGRFLFGEKITYATLRERFVDGFVIKKHSITEEFGLEELKRRYGETAIPLFLIDRDRGLEIFTEDLQLEPEPGEILLSLVDPGMEENDEKPSAETGA